MATEEDRASAAADERRRARLDIAIAALLGVVAVLTAFATYKAVLEDGDTLQSFNEGIRSTDAASQANTEGNQQFTLDTALFLEYAKAARGGEDDLVVYLRESLFTPELTEAVSWWEDSEEALSPFEEGSPYALPAYSEGERLKKKTDESFAEARKHDEDGDKYVLATVVLSVALFLLGIAGIGRRYRSQLVLVAIAGVITVAGLAQILSVAL